MWPAPLTSGGLALEEVTCGGPTPTVLLLDQFFFLISVFFLEDVEKKVELKSPKLHTPR